MAAESHGAAVGRPIARLTVTADPDYLPGVFAFLREAATRIGLAPADVPALERAVGEVADNVIADAFPAEQGGSFDVEAVERAPGARA